MKFIAAPLSRAMWAVTRWWLRRHDHLAVLGSAVDALPEIANRMDYHIQRSGHLSRQYHVRRSLDAAMRDFRLGIGALLT